MDSAELAELQRILAQARMHEAVAKTAASHGAKGNANTSSPSDGVHISIAISPHSADVAATDLAYVKAAVLYADHVSLCSPTAAMMASIMGLSRLDEIERIEFLCDMLPIVNEEGDSTRQVEVLTMLAKALRKRIHSKEEVLLIRQFRSLADELWPPLLEHVRLMMADRGMPELATAVDSGVLILESFPDWQSTDSIVRAYLDSMVTSCNDPSTIPLLDEESAKLLRSALGEGMATIEREQSALQRHGVLAANLMQRLPVLPELSMLETLELRSELQQYLKRFRSEMIKLSESIANATWTPEFAYDVQAVFLRDVEPALLEIDERLREQSLLKALGRAVLSADSAAGTALGVGLSSHTGFEQYTVGLGLALGVGRAVNREVGALKSSVRTTKQSGFYFYYEASKRLGSPM